LKELDRKHGEIKSMRTPDALRRRGAGRAILAHIVEVARSRGKAGWRGRGRDPGAKIIPRGPGDR